MKIFDFCFYKFTRAWVVALVKSLIKLTTVNKESIPSNGGALLVGNHSSWIDTIILSSATKRPIWFVTGPFILKVPVMGSLVRHLCIIPIDNRQGVKAMDEAISKVKEGNLVCIFPEGELTQTGKLLRFRHGVSIIQKETNAPIIPFFIKGAYDVWSYKEKVPKLFRKIELVFGDKFLPVADKDSEITEEIKNKVVALNS